MPLTGRRAVRLGVASAAVALVVVGFLIRTTAGDHPRATERPVFARSTALPPAARRTAIDFIHAVATRDPAGWRLLDRTFPCVGHNRKRAWQARKLRFVPIPRFRHMRFEQPYVTQARASISVVFDQRSFYVLNLKRHRGDQWLVESFDIRWGPPSATCSGQALG